MKVILGSDSLQQPLTGIGRYALEIARGLLASPRVETLLGYDLGRVHPIEEKLARLGTPAGEAPATGSVLRRRAAQSPLVTTLYQHYVKLLSARLLRGYGDYLFHSPNFHLPRHPGPSVVTVHDLSYRLFPEYHPAARVRWMNSMVPESLQASDRIICVSAATRADVLREYGVAPDKAVVIPLGVDPGFRPRTAQETDAVLARHGLEYGGYFLCVATLEPRKNIEGLLDAYLALPAALRQRFPLVLGGGVGWHSEALLARLAAVEGSGQVRRLGYLPEAELMALYSGAMCFVYPSHYEGFGLPVLEAQASGVPVITSAVSSLPEVACESSLLLPPGDVDALRDALLRAAQDDRWRADCAASGLARAARFTWQQCVDQTIELYHHVHR